MTLCTSAQIQLTPEERLTLLQQNHGALYHRHRWLSPCGCHGLRGNGSIYMTSYRKAQQVVNIRRNPEVAVMVETGERCHERKGLMIRGRCELIEEPEAV